MFVELAVAAKTTLFIMLEVSKHASELRAEAPAAAAAGNTT